MGKHNVGKKVTYVKKIKLNEIKKGIVWIPIKLNFLTTQNVNIMDLHIFWVISLFWKLGICLPNDAASHSRKTQFYRNVVTFLCSFVYSSSLPVSLTIFLTWNTWPDCDCIFSFWIFRGKCKNKCLMWFSDFTLYIIFVSHFDWECLISWVRVV